MKWEKTMTAVKKTRLTKPKTVALVGFAKNSREQAPFDKRSVEIWSCNEAYNGDFLKNSDGDFRIDRWFQIHKEEDWSRLTNTSDPQHLDWLMNEHNFPIYMQEKYSQVPNSKKLPKDALNEMFFSNLYTTDDEGKEVEWLSYVEDGFYTSSFAFMMAMAVYEGFERIEVWGFNMGTQSEYGAQATGGTFWMSAAMNRGIDVLIAGSSPFMRLPVYGYEYGDILLISDIEKRAAEIESDMPELKDKLLVVGGAKHQLDELVQASFGTDKEELGNHLVPVLHRRMQDELQASALYNFWGGALEECNLFIRALKSNDNPKGWIDRLSLEIRYNGLEDEIRTAKETLDTVSGAKAEVKYTLESVESSEELEELFANRGLALMELEIYWSNRLNWNLGAQTQDKWFMLMIDKRQPNQVDEKDFSQMWVPELFLDNTDVMMMSQEVIDHGTKEAEKIAEAFTGGAGGDIEQPGEPDERSDNSSAD